MHKEFKTWFAATAFAGLTFSLVTAGTAIAQPPGRGPGGPGGPSGPGRGGPPNVEEMFSRMDQNKDGKLKKDEVPGPMWERLRHLDRDGDGWVTKDEASKGMPGGGPDGRRPDGARPDGGRPAGSPSDRPRQDQSPDRGPRPPMDQPRGDAPRGEERGPRDAGPEHGRPAPPHSPGQPDHGQSGSPDNAHHGPAAFSPAAFFDRMDKNHDGSLSRDEFNAIAALHQGLLASHGPQGFGGHPGPGGPPMAHHGRGMPGGGPPWAHHEGGNSQGPQGFHSGPPWARSNHGPQMHGPQMHGKFAGPPWAQHSPHNRDTDHGKKHKANDKKKGSDHGKKKGNDHGKKKQHQDRSDSHDRDHGRHTGTASPDASADLVTSGTSQQTLPL